MFQISIDILWHLAGLFIECKLLLHIGFICQFFLLGSLHVCKLLCKLLGRQIQPSILSKCGKLIRTDLI